MSSCKSKYNMTEWVNTKNDVSLKKIKPNVFSVIGMAWFRNDYTKQSECVESNLFIGTEKACNQFISNLCL